MDTIENALNNYLEVLPLSILATIVSLKLRKRGIILTDEQVGALKKIIAETKTNTVRYEYPDGSGSEIAIEISDNDLILVGKTFDKFINTLEPKVEDAGGYSFVAFALYPCTRAEQAGCRTRTSEEGW